MEASSQRAPTLSLLVATAAIAVLESLSQTLEREGHRVLVAGDGADALRILVGQRVDVVICDATMAVLSGLQLAEAMRADPRLAEIPVILMVDVFDAPTEPLPPGLVVVPKPIVMPHLMGVVAEAGVAVRSRVGSTDENT